jgi:hydrogenase expression/formation protein HypD
MGFTEYEELMREFAVPIVVGGFEPVDLLEAILMLVKQLERGEARVENQYVRSVSYRGNERAQNIMQEVFEIADQKWQGIGSLLRSAKAFTDSVWCSTSNCSVSAAIMNSKRINLACSTHRNAGYDPSGFIRFFDKIATKEGYVNGVSWFRTHPAF